MSVLWIQAARRHLSFDDGGLHGFSERACALVADEGHWSDFTGPVTALTVCLQNRENVSIERDALRKPANCEKQQAAKCNSYRTHTGLLYCYQKENLADSIRRVRFTI